MLASVIGKAVVSGSQQHGCVRSGFVKVYLMLAVSQEYAMRTLRQLAGQLR